MWVARDNSAEELAPFHRFMAILGRSALKGHWRRSPR